jgi:hypothetical protein
MATILDFPQGGTDPDGTRARAGRSHGDTAEIVLFPGVRYERWEEPPQPSKPRRRKAVKRDRLDIIE